MRDSASGKKAADVITGNNGNGILGGMMMMDSRPDMNMMRGRGMGQKGGGGKSKQSQNICAILRCKSYDLLMVIFFIFFFLPFFLPGGYSGGGGSGGGNSYGGGGGSGGGGGGGEMSCFTPNWGKMILMM